MPTINLGTKKTRDLTVNKTLYQRVYQDARWRKLRKLKFSNNPVCEECEKKGRTVQTEEVHHIEPFEVAKGWFELEVLAFDYDNLISLCIPCHKEAHRKLNRG